MILSMKHVLLVTGFALSVTQAAWSQATPPAPSSSHAHEQYCMKEKDRTKTGPCPLKDPSNKNIPGVARRPPAPPEKPAHQSQPPTGPEAPPR